MIKFRFIFIYKVFLSTGLKFYVNSELYYDLTLIVC